MQESQQNVWYLDFGCSNHMSGNKEVFSNLYGNVKSNVTLGNHNKISVMGK